MESLIDDKKNDIGNVKKCLVELGFVCNSYPSAQQLIYTKNNEVVIIKNSKK